MELLYVLLIIICVIIFYKCIKYIFRNSNKIYHYKDLYNEDIKEHYRENIDTNARLRYDKYNFIDDITYYKNLIITQNDILNNFKSSSSGVNPYLKSIKGIYHYIEYSDYMEVLKLNTKPTEREDVEKDFKNNLTLYMHNTEDISDNIKIYYKYYIDSQEVNNIYLLIFLNDNDSSILKFTDLRGRELLNLKYNSYENTSLVQDNSFKLKDCSIDIQKKLYKLPPDVTKINRKSENLIYKSLNSRLLIGPVDSSNAITIDGISSNGVIGSQQQQEEEGDDINNVASDKLIGQRVFLYGINKDTDLYYLDEKKAFQNVNINPVFTYNGKSNYRPHSFYLYGSISSVEGEPYCRYDRSFLHKLHIDDPSVENKAFVKFEDVHDINDINILKKHILENNYTYLYNSYNSYIYLSDNHNIYIKLLIKNTTIENDQYNTTYNNIIYSGKFPSSNIHAASKCDNEAIKKSLETQEIPDTLLESIFDYFQIYIGYINVDRLETSGKKIHTQYDLKLQLITNKNNNEYNKHFIDLYNLRYNSNRIDFNYITNKVLSPFNSISYNIKMKYYIDYSNNLFKRNDNQYDYLELIDDQPPAFKFINTINRMNNDINNIFNIISHRREEGEEGDEGEEGEEGDDKIMYQNYGPCFNNKSIQSVKSCITNKYRNGILGKPHSEETIYNIILVTDKDEYCWGFFILPKDVEGISHFDLKSNNYIKHIKYYPLIIPPDYRNNISDFYNNIDLKSIHTKGEEGEEGEEGGKDGEGGEGGEDGKDKEGGKDKEEGEGGKIKNTLLFLKRHF